MKSPLLILGEKIKEKRQALGLTQGELGGTELSAAYISQVERGLLKPSANALEYLAGRLELSHRELEELAVEDHDLLRARYHLSRSAIWHQLKDYSLAEQELAEVEKVVDDAHAMGYKADVLARAWEIRASLLAEREEKQASMNAIHQAVSFYRQANDFVGVFRCRLFEAKSLRAHGRLLSAVELLQRVISELGDQVVIKPELLWEAKSLLGSLFLETGEPDRALRLLQESLNLAQQIRNPQIYGQELLASTAELDDPGRLRVAVEALEGAEAFFGSAGWSMAHAWNQFELGMAWARKKDYGKARELLNAAVIPIEPVGFKRLKISLALERAQSAFLGKGLWEMSDISDLCNQVLEQTKGEEQEYAYEIGLAHFLLGQVSRSALPVPGRDDIHYELAKNALENAQLTSKVRVLLITVYNRLASLADQAKNMDKAMQYYHKASNLSVSDFSSEALQSS